MALGSIGVLVYMLGFPTVIGTAMLYMHRHRLHTKQSWIDTLGWVCARNLIGCILVPVLAALVPACVVLTRSVDPLVAFFGFAELLQL